MATFLKKTRRTMPGNFAAGLHLTRTAIHCVALSHHNGMMQIEDAFSINNKASINYAPLVTPVSDWPWGVAALQEIFLREPLWRNSVRIAVDDSYVISRHLQLPKMLSDREIEMQIAAEAERYFLVTADEIHFDFMITSSHAVNTELHDVWVIAISKAVIEAYQELAKWCGFGIVAVDVAALAYARAVGKWVSDMLEPRVLLFVDIGWNSLYCMVIKQQKVVFSRNQVTEKWMQANCENSEGFLQEIVRQLREWLQLIARNMRLTTFDGVILSGVEALQKPLKLFFQHEINVETHLADPFSTMHLANRFNQEKVVNNAASLMVSYGLALHN